MNAKDLSSRSSSRKKVFKYTAPSKKVQTPTLKSPRNEDLESLFHTTEFQFVTDVTARFSIKPTSAYLKTSPSPMICAHLNREIKVQKDKLESLEKAYKTNEIHKLIKERNKLQAELNELEKINNSLSEDLGRAGALFGRLALQVGRPLHGKAVRDAMLYKEDYERTLDLYRTQRSALNERRAREMRAGMNDTAASIAETDTATARSEIERTIRRTMEVRKMGEHVCDSLRATRAHLKTALIRRYNADFQDVIVPMTEIIEYVKTEDPVILLERLLAENEAAARQTTIFDFAASE